MSEKYRSLLQRYAPLLLWAFVGGIVLCAFLWRIPELRLATHDEVYPPRSVALRGLLASGLFLWTCCYLLSLWFLVKQERRNGFLPSQETFFLCCLTLLAALAAILHPVTSSDLFDYLAYGREWIVYHVNPYLIPPNVLQDRLLAELPTYWTFQPSVYGPIGIAVGAIPSLLHTQTANALVAGYKVLTFLAFIGYVGLLRTLFRVLRHVFSFSAFFGIVANPLFLWLLVVDGHNEVYLLFALLASLLLLFSKQPFLSGLFFAAAAAVKIVPIVLFPLFVAFLLSKKERGLRNTIFFSVGFSACSILVYLPFLHAPIWQILGHMLPAFRSPQLFGPVAQFLAYMSIALFPSSPIGGVIVALRLSQLLLVLFVLLVAFRMRRERQTFHQMIAMIATVFTTVLLTSNYIQPWYVLWMFPFLLLAAEKPRWIYLLSTLFSCTVLLGILVHPSTGIMTIEACALLVVLLLLAARFVFSVPFSTLFRGW